ncbi:MAG: 1,3-beta-galactosyl-N-acetylhexosamine phosphorylase [Bacilli bacterium]|nr:1,3-beta-galactosyl-N-acetylhexosamine phosphorylase [Bacilli bacterium]
MKKGFVTIPTDSTFVEGTKRFIEKWGADAVRDCDGVTLPENVSEFGTEVYKAYFIVREDHEYAKKHPELLQSYALVTDRKTAFGTSLEINLLENVFKEAISVNEDRKEKYWQVIDRTTGEIHKDWEYIGNDIVRINNCVKYHEYTVNFFAKNTWDPVQIYNYHSNHWKDVPIDLDLDPIYPEAMEHMLMRMEEWCKSHPEVTVVRFTTFFYNFFIIYKTGFTQTFWDWHTYAATASPEMFDYLEKTYGFKMSLEDLVTGGTYGSRYQIPSKTLRTYMDYVQQLCCGWAKKFVDIVHKYGKKAMMFDGDHRIGVEPYCPYFESIGLDAVVGAPHSGPYIRLLTDMMGIKYTEGRLNPYFFPNECPSDEKGIEYLSKNWNSERRTLLKKCIDRIGFGGYLKLASTYPNFCEYIATVCDEFRTIKENVGKGGAKSLVKVAFISYWGRMYSWMNNGTFTDDTKPETEGYATFFNAVAAQPVEVSFISFDEVMNEKDLNSKYDVLVNSGLAGSAFQGDYYWKNELLLTKVREFVANGGGFVGIGDPTGYEYNGKYFQLSDVLGVQKEIGFTYSRTKFFPSKNEKHWIVEDVDMSKVAFGKQGLGVYPLGADVIAASESNFNPTTCLLTGGNVYLSANEYGKGRGVYINSLLDSYDAFRLVYKVLLWASHKEELYKKALSTNVNVDCYYYGEGKYALINNSNEKVDTTMFDINGNPSKMSMDPNEIKWINK